MKLLMLCFGALLFIYFGGFDVKANLYYLDQGTTGTVHTLIGDNGSSNTMVTHTPNDIFEIINNTDISIVSGEVIDHETTTEHVLVVTSTDDENTTSTATVTFSVYPIFYIQPFECIELVPGTPSDVMIHQSHYYGSTTATLKAKDKDNTSLITFYPGYNALVVDKPVLASTRKDKLTIYIEAEETYGIPSTATQTVVICVNGYCSCNDLLSSAAQVTTVLISSLSVLILIL